MPSSIRYDDLPKDLQTLISQIHETDAKDPLPESFDIIDMPITMLPLAELDESDRGSWYARAMSPETTPPVLIAHGYFIDGKHRLFNHYDLGLKSIRTIDLTSYVTEQMASLNSLGEVGTQGNGWHHKKGGEANLAVWDFERKGFLCRIRRSTNDIEEALKYSWDDIHRLFISGFDYQVFNVDFMDEHKLDLHLHERPGQTKPKSSVWTWEYTGFKDAGSSCDEGFASHKECLEDAQAYALEKLHDTRYVDPYFLLATKTPIVHQLQHQPGSCISRLKNDQKGNIHEGQMTL